MKKNIFSCPEEKSGLILVRDLLSNDIFPDITDYHSLCKIAISCVLFSLTTFDYLARSATQRGRVVQVLYIN